jgi:hypothetical protein
LIPVKKLLTTAVDGLGAAAAIFKDCSLIVAVNVTPQQCRNGECCALPPPTRIMDLLISTKSLRDHRNDATTEGEADPAITRSIAIFEGS